MGRFYLLLLIGREADLRFQRPGGRMPIHQEWYPAQRRCSRENPVPHLVPFRFTLVVIHLQKRLHGD
jgi:hypothetical protein